MTAPDSEISIQPIIRRRLVDVSSERSISATFQVPGLISIPSDGIIHNVTDHCEIEFGCKDVIISNTKMLPIENLKSSAKRLFLRIQILVSTPF